MNKDKKYLSQEVKDAFIEYDWPGNIRELENVLEHGICFAAGDEIMLRDLPDYFLDNRISNMLKKEKQDKDYIDNQIYKELLITKDKNLEQLKEEFERNIINRLIDIYGNSVEGKKW